MGKVQQFRDKPSPYSYGQYYYDDDDMGSFDDFEASDSVRKPYDRFSTQTLETTIETDYTRDYVVEKNLKKIGDSYITINALGIINRGVNYKVKNTHMRGFIFDRNTFDCLNSNGTIK